MAWESKLKHKLLRTAGRDCQLKSLFMYASPSACATYHVAHLAQANFRIGLKASTRLGYSYQVYSNIPLCLYLYAELLRYTKVFALTSLEYCYVLELIDLACG
jgi:hypothetical protein